MKKVIAVASLLLVGGYFYSNMSEQNDGLEITENTQEVEKSDVVELNFTVDEYKASIPGWNVGLEKVYEESKRTGKPIMANFTGSDWCGWCKRLKASVFVKQEFKTWAADNVVLYEVDFPRTFTIPEKTKQENRSLQQSLQVRGYPTVWLMKVTKKDGKYNINALGKLSYEASATTFINKAKKILKK